MKSLGCVGLHRARVSNLAKDKVAGSSNADNQITFINAISRIDRRTRVDLSFAFVIEFEK
jgi:hypothetical protein